MFTVGRSQDEARSERCEGGCRSDAELRQVGTEMIHGIVRLSPEAKVGSREQIALA
jgi:hypothetical protein